MIGNCARFGARTLQWSHTLLLRRKDVNTLRGPSMTSSPTPSAPNGDGPQAALTQALVKIEQQVDQLGWDRPVVVFALARTLSVLDNDPALAKLLPPEARSEAEQNPQALTAVVQDSLPPAQTLEELLAAITWPEYVEGAAICTESTVVPKEVEEQALGIADAGERQEFLTSHPEHQDMRVLAGVLRSGESWTLMRARGVDGPSDLLQGENLVPQLVDGLRATLA